MQLLSFFSVERYSAWRVLGCTGWAFHRVAWNVRGRLRMLLRRQSYGTKKSMRVLILPMTVILGACCAPQQGATVIQRGSVIHLTKTELMQEVPLSNESLRQIARNNELLRQ